MTSVSGRGVGMDAVKRQIDALRGSVRVSSQPGQGTCIALTLPLTLAIIDGLLVEIGRDQFIVPMSVVTENVELARTERDRKNGANVVAIRGELVPYVRLREAFAITGPELDVEKIVIARHGEDRVGLVVDRVLGSHQTVIQPLGRFRRHIELVSGATIMGDGRVALILDLGGLVRMADEAPQPGNRNHFGPGFGPCNSNDQTSNNSSLFPGRFQLKETMKLTIGKKIGLGFASVLLILITIGGFSIVKMKTAVTDSKYLSEDYVPELDIAAKLQSGMADVRVNGRSYQFTGEKTYLESGRKALTSVKGRGQGVGRTGGQDNQAGQAQGTGETVPGLVSSYEQLLAETEKAAGQLDERQRRPEGRHGGDGEIWTTCSCARTPATKPEMKEKGRTGETGRTATPRFRGAEPDARFVERHADCLLPLPGLARYEDPSGGRPRILQGDFTRS